MCLKSHTLNILRLKTTVLSKLTTEWHWLAKTILPNAIQRLLVNVYSTYYLKMNKCKKFY